MLAEMADVLVSTDIAAAPDDLAPNETFVQADIADFDAVLPLLEGADMVVHFGAIVDEKPFPELLGPNYIGAYNVWEAAYRHGVRRVVYASSIHAVGMCETAAGIDTDEPHRPDTFYGLAKCFTEDLASLYWDKRGLECVAMRIYSASGKPGNSRAIGSFLSDRDMIQLVEKSVTSPTVGFTVVYGVSNNDRCPVDNSKASFLGFRPQDNAEDWAAEIYAGAPPQDNRNPEDMCHGGPFAVVPLGESGVEMIRKRSVKG